MLRLAKDLWTDQAGFVVSAEMVLISTVGVIGVGTGLVCLRDAVNRELSEVACALTALDQSYCYTGFHGYKDSCHLRLKAQTAGSSYPPRPDTEIEDGERDHEPARHERLVPIPDHAPPPHVRSRDHERDGHWDHEERPMEDRVIRKPVRTRDTDAEDSDTPVRHPTLSPPGQPRWKPLHVPHSDRLRDE